MEALWCLPAAAALSACARAFTSAAHAHAMDRPFHSAQAEAASSHGEVWTDARGYATVKVPPDAGAISPPFEYELRDLEPAQEIEHVDDALVLDRRIGLQDHGQVRSRGLVRAQQALELEDPLTSRPRGYFVLSRASDSPTLCCAPDEPVSWARIEQLIFSSVREMVAASGQPSLEALVGAITSRMPEDALSRP